MKKSIDKTCPHCGETIKVEKADIAYQLVVCPTCFTEYRVANHGSDVKLHETDETDEA